MLRHLFTARQPLDSSKALKQSFPLQSLHDFAWYCQWQGLTEHSLVSSMPSVEVAELLAPLGMPYAQQQAAMQQLSREDIPMLQQVALREYLDAAVDIMDKQLQGLGIHQLYQQQQLFAGYDVHPCLT